MESLAALKKKIAALEAQVERVTKAELGNAITKIRKLMADYGVTIEHLTDGRKTPRAVRKAAGAKAAKRVRPAKYQDPKTGATWSGLGRIPAWIAKAKDRDAFLVGGAGVGEAAVTTVGQAAPRKTGKRAAAAPARGKKAAPAKKSASAKQAGAKKPAVRKGRQAPKAVAEAAAASTPVGADAPGA